MDRCHENQELLLDFLYGLLELSEVEGVKEHLAECTACRGSLSVAQAHRLLFSKAAQVYDDIPEFRLPEGAEAEPAVAMIEAPAPKPATLPMSAPRRRNWFVPASFAAAAAVLIAVFGLRSLYVSGFEERQNAVAAAHKKIEANASEGSQLRAKLETKQNEILGRLAAQSMHLVAMGPTVLEPEAHSPLRIIIQDLQGKPYDATVQVKLVDEKTQKPIFEKALIASAGVASLNLSPLPIITSGPARLRIATIDGTDAIEETVQLTASSLVTHLATNKITYHPGELLFFRTVTLERFSLRPTAEKLRLKVALRDAAGQTVKQFYGNIQAGGIAGGEIALGDNMQAGEYVLEISEAAETGRMPAVRRVLNVVTGEEAKVGADALAEKTILVDFYPEGGELVAGIESRVYYRVRDGRGMPVDFAGQLVIGDRPVGSFSNGPAGSLGVFTLTPLLGETYQIRITRPNLPPVSVPCKLHELVREQGVVLSVRANEETLKAAITNNASEKMLLVAVTCRGRVVDQQLVLAKAGKTDVVLNPLTEAHGVLRVTVYDGERPLAERLVYRPSKQYLKLSANRSLGVSPFGAAQVTLQLQSANEQDQVAPAWVLAYVADGKLARKPCSDLAAHFFLGGDIDSSEALESTAVFAGDNPQAREAIDLFLGTVGWRRFVRPERAPAALAKAETRDPAKALFCRENGSLAKLQDRAAQAMTQAIAALQQEGIKERARLIGEREQAELEMRLASAELAEYRTRPQTWLRLAGGVLVLVLLVVGAACVAWGFVQTSRRRFATPAFAGAAASLGLCLFLYALAGHLGGSVDSPGGIAGGRGTIPEVDVKQVAMARTAGMMFPTGYVPAFVPEPTALQARLGQLTQTADAVLVAAADMKVRYKQALDREKGDNSAKAEPSKGPQLMVAPGTLKKDDKSKPVEVKPNIVKPGAAPADMFAREYAFRQIQKGAVRQDLILWSPMINLQKGSHQLSFDLPAEASSFRMFLFGHSADGRFGFLEERWEAK